MFYTNFWSDKSDFNYFKIIPKDSLKFWAILGELSPLYVGITKIGPIVMDLDSMSIIIGLNHKQRELDFLNVVYI